MQSGFIAISWECNSSSAFRGWPFSIARASACLLGLSEDESSDVHASVIYYKVDDLEGTHDAFRSRGISFDSGPHKIADMPDHETVDGLFFRDSEMNLMALMAEKPRDTR